MTDANDYFLNPGASVWTGAGDSRPPTTEEARALSVRWVWWRRYDATTKAWETEQPPHADLTPSERGRLFAWMRERLNEASILITGHVLGITYTEAQDLAKAAGWSS